MSGRPPQHGRPIPGRPIPGRPIPGRGGRILALLSAELKAAVRDYGTLVSLVAMTVLVGVLAHGQALIPDDGEDDDGGGGGPSASWDCRVDELAPVAVAGEVPAWLWWPGPMASGEEAEVLLRFGPRERPGAPLPVEVVALQEEARTRAIADCLDHLRDEERRARFDALGLPAAPESLAREVTVVAAARGAAPPDRGPPSTLGLSIASGIALLLMSVFLDTGPRARASGWLESWLSLPGHRSDLVLAWWLMGLLFGTVGVGLVLAGHELGRISLGADTGGLTVPALAPLVALTSAIGVRAFLDVEDVRTALVRSVPVLLGTTALFGLAMLAEEHFPGWGAAVPLGGVALVLAGWSDGVALAVVSGFAFTALVLWDCSRVLDRMAVNLGAMSATAARRARGDYLPEALLLFFVAAAGAGAWAPPELLLPDVVLRTLLTMPAFFLLPALFVSIPLGLERRPLLSLRRPPWHSWLLLPLLLPGTLSLGGALWHVAAQLAPDNEVTQAYGEVMGAFDNPLGLFAISVVPGICEEFLFRGAIFGLLRKRLPTWAALVLQALAFALLHGLAVRLPYTFALGIVFGLVVLRTGSLWPAVVAHLLHNFISTQLPEQAFMDFIATPWAWVVGLLGCSVVWLMGPRRPKRP